MSRASIQVLEPFVGFFGAHEELHLHLFELPSSENELPWGYLVTECLPHLSDPEWQLEAIGAPDVLVVDEDALGSFRPQVNHVVIGLDRTDVSPEHQIEFSGLSELPPFPARGALVGVGQFVETVARVAVAALHHRIGEYLLVPRRLPNPARLNDGRIQPDHIGTLLNHRAPPLRFHVAEKLNSERPVVVGGAETAVDLGRLEHEATLLGQVGNEVEGHFCHGK